MAGNRDDVLTGVPSFGFSSDDEAEPTVWFSGNWYSTEQTVENVNDKYVKSYVAQILVSGVGGGGTMQLPDGESFVFTRVTMPDGQVPVKLAGKVTVI